MAGAVNAIGLLGFRHQAVSHLTGTSTLMGLALAEGNLGETWHLLWVVASFVGGAALGGLLIDNEALKLGRRYSIALCLESGLLGLAMMVLQNGSSNGLGAFAASAACGLQNSMVSTYSGAVLRTTHVSGLFTDLGTMIGHRLRGHRFDQRRAKLYVLLILGFILGGTVGSWAYWALRFYAFALPAGVALALALVYTVYRLRQAAARAAAMPPPHA